MLVIATFCVDPYTPGAGVKTGAAALAVPGIPISIADRCVALLVFAETNPGCIPGAPAAAVSIVSVATPLPPTVPGEKAAAAPAGKPVTLRSAVPLYEYSGFIVTEKLRKVGMSSMALTMAVPSVGVSVIEIDPPVAAVVNCKS